MYTTDDKELGLVTTHSEIRNQGRQRIGVPGKVRRTSLDHSRRGYSEFGHK